MDALSFLYTRGYTDMTELHQMLLRCRSDGADPTPIYDLICHTRCRKGERDLSYRMILTLFSVFPDLGLAALRRVIYSDAKYFCLFVEKEVPEEESDRYEPLVSLAVSLANSALRLRSAGKWIPREKKHRDLYDRFVRDWFGTSFVTSRMRQEYRYIVSAASSAPDPVDSARCRCRDRGIGKYFTAGLCAGADADAAKASWSALMGRLGADCCHDCIPIVDIDIEVGRDALYNALGFACLIAQKSGVWRVLLISSEPIWVDLTEASGDFCAMVALLWEHCEIRSRSNFSSGLDLICRALSSSGSPSSTSTFRLVIFSETFAFDWFYWVPLLGSVVFWNIGHKAAIPCDFYPEDYLGLTLMSGVMPGLVSSIGSSSAASFSSTGS